MSDGKPAASGRLIAIGQIYTPFKTFDDTPIHGTAGNAKGTVAVLPEYADGLTDMEGFDRIWLLYLGPAENRQQMRIIPRLDQVARGVFATRSPRRPNPIGMVCVRLTKIVGCTLHVEGVDMVDGTPLLDIKPYVPRFDAYSDAWAGWLENRVPHERAWQHRSAEGAPNQHGQ